MNKKYMVLGLCIAPAMSWAAVMMENRDFEGEVTRIYIEGSKARVEMPGEDTYMVVDESQRSVKIVSDRERTVMDVSDMFDEKADSSTSNGSKIDASSRRKGKGPEIAGYDTEEYEIQANGEYCGSVFVSAEALKQAEIKRLASMLEKMGNAAQDNMGEMMGGALQSFMSPCDIAADQQSDRLMSLGMPMRVLDDSRQIESEVVRIDRNAKLPVNAFLIPQDYRQTNPRQQMNDAMQQAKQMNPQIQEMLKNLPPQVQEMMRQRMGQ